MEASLGASDSNRGKTYVFAIRPTPDSPAELPNAWWLPGALGPLATLEASKNGLRIVRRSPAGTALQIGAGLGLGLVLMVGVWPSIILFFAGELGVDIGSLLGLGVASALVMAIVWVLAPRIRKLGAWHPQGPFVPIQVLSASLGSFHQELLILGDGHRVRVQTNAPRTTITQALRLARQIPPDAGALR